MRGAGQLRELGAGGDGLKLAEKSLRERPILGIVAQVTNRIGAADRVGLAEEVVGEADAAVRIGSAKLGERGTRALAHLGLGDPEQRAQIAIALALLEEQPEHGLLIGSQRHRTKAR